jgi:WD40 repeat protein
MDHKMVDSSDEEEDLELPPEIWRLVCDSLNPKQLGRLARTSRDVRKAVRGSPAFRQLLRYDGVWEDVHERSILGVAVTGDSIVTASEDRTLKILAAADGSCRSTLTGHTNRVRCVCIMPDGRIVSGSRDCTLIVWAPDGSLLRTLHEHTDYVWCMAALSDDRVASGSKDGCIHIWDVNTGHHLSGIYVNGAVRCLAVLPDGIVIAGGGEGRLKLWDVMQGNCIRSTQPDEESITSVAVLYESVVVAGGEDGSLTLWDTNAEKDVIAILTLRGHGTAVWALLSLPNKRFVTADSNGLLEVWRADLALGPKRAFACLQTLRGHARAAFCLAALPDGRIVSGSMDRTLRFWAPVGTQIDRGARDAPSRT